MMRPVEVPTVKYGLHLLETFLHCRLEQPPALDTQRPFFSHSAYVNVLSKPAE